MAKKHNVNRGHSKRPSKKSRKGAETRERVEAEQKKKSKRRSGNPEPACEATQG